MKVYQSYWSYNNLKVLRLLFFSFQSECLREAFDELDMTSEVLQILMSPDNPFFRLSTFGYAGSTHVSSPL